MAKTSKKQENPLLSKNIPQPPMQPEETKGEEAVQSDGTVVPQYSVKPQSMAKREKITFYPNFEQAEKIYDLIDAYRRRTGIKINQQDLLRRLVEVATMEMLLPQ